MLFVLFQLGNDRYALEATSVVEVVPLLGVQQIPHAPRGVAGVFNYRGQPVPAVDLCELTHGRPAHERLSTRIIVVNHPDADGSMHLLGIIAEQAVETLRKEAADFVAPGVNPVTAPYLGPILTDSKGVIQWIREQRLLPEHVRDLLFAEPAPST